MEVVSSETITITAGTVAQFTASNIEPSGSPQVRAALCQVGTGGPILYHVDGTDPSVGTFTRSVGPRSTFLITGPNDMKNFRAINLEAGRGNTIFVQYMR
jgi:hypothetical protein